MITAKFTYGVKHLNKGCKSLKCINCNRLMCNSIIITVNFSNYSIIDTCHFPKLTKQPNVISYPLTAIIFIIS